MGTFINVPNIDHLYVGTWHILHVFFLTPGVFSKLSRTLNVFIEIAKDKSMSLFFFSP